MFLHHRVNLSHFHPSTLCSLEGSQNAWPTFIEWGIMLSFFEGEVCMSIIWKSVRDICLFTLMYLFFESYLGMDLWVFFYTLGYNLIPLYLFYCSYCSSFCHWELFKYNPVSLWHCVCFEQFLTFLLILSISCPSTKISSFIQRTLVSFIAKWY